MGVWDIMTSLRDCLCQEIESSDVIGEVCFCGVIGGQFATEDYIDPGMAWVRLVNSFPSLQFPNQTQDARSCSAPLAWQIEVGIMRCSPRMNTRANPPRPPTQEQWHQATLAQVAEMEAMHRAILCCLGRGRDAVLGNYVPIGPGGDVLGGTWTVWVTE